MKSKRKTGTVITFIVVLIGALIFLLPYVYMIISSTQNNETIMGNNIDLRFGHDLWNNLKELEVKYHFSKVILNSIWVSVMTTVFATISSTLAGFSLAVYKFRGRNAIFMLVLLGRMVPTFATLIPLFYILSRLGLTNTFSGLIIPGIAGTTAVFIMRQYSLQFPVELLESARIDGANDFQALTKIALPVLKPAIVTNALLIFMGSWNSYLFPLVMLTDSNKYTASLVIKQISTVSLEPINYGALMLALTISVVPTIILYIWVQSKYKGNQVGSAIK